MTKLSAIEGIGPVYAQKLRDSKIGSLESLLKQGSSPAGRKAIVEATGISKDLILEWVNRADLFRIKGVAEEYSDLLEVSGVDTVVELSRRNAENLHAKMVEVNAGKNKVRKLPTQAQVTDWVAQAKQLDRAITY